MANNMSREASVTSGVSSGLSDSHKTPGNVVAQTSVTSLHHTHKMKSAEAEQTPKVPRRRPVPGKGFRKTRRGCFNCKRRRVKCSEGRPECHGCRRMGMDCVYPASLLPAPHQQMVPAAPTVKVCADHLRFFHHFLVEAYPPHPYGASGVWQDAAALSHEVRTMVSSPRSFYCLESLTHV
jgi:hypothetical protein